VTTPRIVALVPAAGGGARFGGALPKQYAELHGLPVLIHTLARLRTGMAPARLVVAIAPEDLYYERVVGRHDDVTVLRCGGATRAQTVRNAMNALAPDMADHDWLAVHDAARPCVPPDALARLAAHLADDPVGGLLAIPVADTLKRSDRGGDTPRVVRTEDRAQLWQAQTPQMFRFGVLARALADATADAATDEAQAVEALGLSPQLVRGSPANIKITYAEDLALAAAILSAQQQEGFSA
jgi:2-C-methyl-D-erythritol 4-phosphate cytidylyltransferase